MQFILAAILIVVGAGPVSDWILLSPYAHYLTEFRQSPSITALVGHPEWLLTGAYMLACYGVAGQLLGAGYALVMPTHRFVSSDVSPFQAPKMRSLGGLGEKAPTPPK
jgi:hypothetical protein